MRKRYLIRIDGMYVGYVRPMAHGGRQITMTPYLYDAADCCDEDMARKLAEILGGTPVEFNPINGDARELT